MSGRMTDDEIVTLRDACAAEMRRLEKVSKYGSFLASGQLREKSRILDALVAERAEVERLEDEVEYLRSRCERRDGDPTVEGVRRWASTDAVARALLRAWWEDEE